MRPASAVCLGIATEEEQVCCQKQCVAVIVCDRTEAESRLLRRRLYPAAAPGHLEIVLSIRFPFNAGVELNVFRLSDFGIPYGYSPVLVAAESYLQFVFRTQQLLPRLESRNSSVMRENSQHFCA